MSWDENLTALQVSHSHRTVCLNAFPSSFLNSYVHKLPTERRQADMNERNGGWVCMKGWKLGHEGGRINHQVRRMTPPDWKNSRGFSPSLSALIFLFLSSLFVFLFFFPLQCTHGWTYGYLFNCSL